MIERELSQDQSGYFQDILGESDSDVNSFQQKALYFFQSVCNLEDDDYIELELQPDLLCLSCKEGKHCSALNFSLTAKATDIIAKEQSVINNLINELDKNNFQVGSDFFSHSTHHLLFNFNGILLTSNQTTPEIHSFQSIFVKTSVMRTIPYSE